MTKTTKIIAALGVVAGIGVAALPISSFAASTQDVTVRVTIGSSIAVGVDQDTTEVTMSPNQTDTSTLKTKVTVTTNNATGYQLQVKDKDTDTGLKSGTNVIPAAASLSAGTAGWNVKGGDKVFASGAAITAADQLVMEADTPPAASGAIANMTYGVATATNQASGTYTDIITYTATAK